MSKNIARIKCLQEEHEIVIPDGINYSNFPKKYWAYLEAFERAIWPFMVVKARMKTTPDPPAGLDIDRRTYHAQAGQLPIRPKLQAVVVDSKTFHCTLGGEWDLDLSRWDREIDPESWARIAKEELLEGYRQHYGIRNGRYGYSAYERNRLKARQRETVSR